MASVRILPGTFRIEPRGGFGGRRFLAGLATYWAALRESAAAAHAYDELTRHGTSHQDAIARVFEEHYDRR